MFSVIFPGQGSQIIGMGKEFYDNFTYVKQYFLQADEFLRKDLSGIILNGPKELLDQTENTQPAIFLVSYSIYKVIENETKFNIKDANFYAGHSLGEYSALCCAESISFEQTLNLLNHRGKSMQNAVPKGEGGMLAVLGIQIDELNKIIDENSNKFQCYIANDNSTGLVVLSGSSESIESISNLLFQKKVKFVKLPVSAPFHCPLMTKATQEMKDIILETEFKKPKINIISNVDARPQNKPEIIKNLLIQQIENPVKWRESVNYMINSGVKKFVEIGPGKVLSGLIKRIDRNVKLNQVNNLNDAKDLLND